MVIGAAGMVPRAKSSLVPKLSIGAAGAAAAGAVVVEAIGAGPAVDPEPPADMNEKAELGCYTEGMRLTKRKAMKVEKVEAC